MSKPTTLAKLALILAPLRKKGKRIVFTNGVFDIVHRGHIEYLKKAKSFGDILVVGLNSDISVRRLKGPSRPIQKQADRAAILLELRSVDYVIFFSDPTPLSLIERIRPDLLVKGADYKLDQIVGADFLKSYSGQVKRVRIVKGRSSSSIIKKMYT
ncbi:MAG: D-glycero-beta-D-manno-heptose 1-phosphate adenylyltransferase [candidate division Zixibacteria bacterium]|nr:D-glycero-beta-D-manno-heptose 1-phosphate adenylyltransferase [candidate division Zixibacteria bacterium]